MYSTLQEALWCTCLQGLLPWQALSFWAPANNPRLDHANIPFIILGTGLLWFGWFGFNAGSALGANDDAVLAFANTHFASAAGMITWIFFERFQGRKMNAVGACIGAIVGLVAITPAAGFVTIQESILIGFTAALVSNWAIARQKRGGLDDTLGRLPFSRCWRHGRHGMLTGVFASEVGLTSANTATFTWHLIALIGHGCFHLCRQLCASSAWWTRSSLCGSAVGKRRLGLDESQHGEQLD